MKKKGKWKVFGYSILSIIIVAVAAFGYEFYQLQPKNHFKSIPVVSSGKATETTKSKSNSNQQSNTNDPSMNILVLGSDERPGETIGHSDTMLLAHVDLGKGQVNAISIPRDTRVHLDGYGYTKLTSVQYILQADKGPKKGIEEAVNAISELTGVPINYYVETNFEGLQALVDTLGGITINVPETIKINNQVVNAGSHFVNGTMALAIARERHTAADGDYARQMAQLEILKAIGKDALSPGNIPKLPSFVNSISKYLIGTNMSTSDMMSLGLALKNMNPDQQLHYEQIAGVEKTMYDDILKANNSEIVIDPQHMKQVIAEKFQ